MSAREHITPFLAPSEYYTNNELFSWSRVGLNMPKSEAYNGHQGTETGIPYLYLPALHDMHRLITLER